MLQPCAVLCCAVLCCASFSSFFVGFPECSYKLQNSKDNGDHPDDHPDDPMENAVGDTGHVQTLQMPVRLEGSVGGVGGSAPRHSHHSNTTKEALPCNTITVSHLNKNTNTSQRCYAFNAGDHVTSTPPSCNQPLPSPYPPFLFTLATRPPSFLSSLSQCANAVQLSSASPFEQRAVVQVCQADTLVAHNVPCVTARKARART